MQHISRRGLALAVLGAAGFGALLATSEPAAAAKAGCEAPVRDLRQGFAGLGTATTPAEPGSVEAQDRARQGAELYQAALEAHPECADDFQTLIAEIQAAARSQSVEKGTPFLGPIGWLWNNVYYRVFNGNDVMMAIFGWALLLSPVILVVSAIWVMRGARGAFRKPFVPEHLRTET